MTIDTGPTSGDLPIIDGHIYGGWSTDLEPEDVRDILSRMKCEAEKGVAELEVAHRAGDRPAVRRLAHKLKGMMGNLGAARLAHGFRDLEVGASMEKDLDPELGRLRPLLDESLVAFGLS